MGIPTGWHVQDNTDEVHGQLRVDDDAGAVCIVGTRTPTFTPCEDMHRYAHLIAAAPALLAGLKELLEYDENSCSVGDYGYEVMQRCKAAVAKAEPKRKVKVQVTVEVEVDAHRDALPGAVVKAAVDAVRGGDGKVTHHAVIG
jgi:hypothetical protein